MNAKETMDRDAVERWVASFDDVDREVAIHALSCRLNVLDSQVIDRVLRGDGSVCGCNNPAAFSRLQDMLKLHFALRRKAGDALGQLQASELETFVVNDLKQSFPDLEIRWPTGRA